MEEPSVLDYLKSKLNPWQHQKLEIPAAGSSGVEDRSPESILPEGATFPDESTTKDASFSSLWVSLPWRGLAALFIALLAQYSLGPRPDRQVFPGVIFLVLSFGFLAWAVWSGELELPNTTTQEVNPDPPTLNPSSLLIGLLLALAAFLAFGALQFTILNLCLLGLSVFFVVRAFWVRQSIPRPSASSYLMRLHRPPWLITIKDSAILGLAVLLLLVFFRFFRLEQVPPEMNSDHAEKFLDVLRVLSGQTMVFFSSNGGREALQFYLVAGLHRLAGLPLDFTILKLVTTAIGFLALPFIYLTGRELGNKRAGLLAALFAGIAYWPNVVSRVGLRLPFYMLFTAALFYTLSRGLRRGSQNAFIAAGIILGIGMYGYSADRILPLLVVAAISLYLIHKKTQDRNEFTRTWIVCALVACDRSGPQRSDLPAGSSLHPGRSYGLFYAHIHPNGLLGKADQRSCDFCLLKKRWPGAVHVFLGRRGGLADLDPRLSSAEHRFGGSVLLRFRVGFL